MVKFVAPPWLNWAIKEVGTAEIPGPKNNPRIVQYWDIGKLSSVNPGRTEEVSWCAAFIAAALASAGVDPWNKGTARSVGDPKHAINLGKPVYGALAVKKRVGGAAWQGHTGIVVAVSADGKKVCLLGGNQSDRVSYAWFNTSEFSGGTGLGFWWPKISSLPELVSAPVGVPGNSAPVREA